LISKTYVIGVLYAFSTCAKTSTGQNKFVNISKKPILMRF
jgi:hypothetical protein